MKLAKLSLAAIVAAGAMTTFANAAPLEEAIKGVDFSGMLRYRLNDVEQTSAANVESTSSENDWDFLGKFTAPVDENTKAVMAFASSSTQGNNKDGSNGTLNVDLRKAFFVYSKDALTVRAGMQDLGTPVTDNGFNGNKGTGVLAMYDASPVTLAAAYFSGANTNIYTGTAGSGDVQAAAGVTDDTKAEIMAAAAIASFDPVNVQLWAISMQNVVDTMWFAQADAKIANFNVVGQFINTDLSDRVGGEDGNYFALKAGAGFEGFSANAGYTKNDDDQGVYSVAGADSSVIHPGLRLGYEVNNVADTESYFLDAGYKMGQFGFFAGYAIADVDDIANKHEYSEMWGKVSYQVSKKLGTYVYYSSIEDGVAGSDYEKDYFRFEANYSF